MGMNLHRSRRRIFETTMAASLSIVAAGVWWWLGPAHSGAVSGFFLTADQQARRLFEAGDAQGAAARFIDPYQRAAAHYRAGNFVEAAGIWAGLEGPESAYNQGTALVMAGKYLDAVARFDGALAQRPDWEVARVNREIALQRAERIEREGGDMTGGKLGADDIVFDQGESGGGGDPEQQPQDGGPASDAALQAAWLRRVQTSPGDFLRAKFAYQRSRSDGQP